MAEFHWIALLMAFGLLSDQCVQGIIRSTLSGGIKFEDGLAISIPSRSKRAKLLKMIESEGLKLKENDIEIAVDLANKNINSRTHIFVWGDLENGLCTGEIQEKKGRPRNLKKYCDVDASERKSQHPLTDYERYMMLLSNTLGRIGRRLVNDLEAKTKIDLPGGVMKDTLSGSIAIRGFKSSILSRSERAKLVTLLESKGWKKINIYYAAKMVFIRAKNSVAHVFCWLSKRDKLCWGILNEKNGTHGYLEKDCEDSEHRGNPHTIRVDLFRKYVEVVQAKIVEDVWPDIIGRLYT